MTVEVFDALTYHERLKVLWLMYAGQTGTAKQRARVRQTVDDLERMLTARRGVLPTRG